MRRPSPVWPDGVERPDACASGEERDVHALARGGVRGRHDFRPDAVREVGRLVGRRHEAARPLVRGRGRRRARRRGPLRRRSAPAHPGSAGSSRSPSGVPWRRRGLGTRAAPARVPRAGAARPAPLPGLSVDAENPPAPSASTSPSACAPVSRRTHLREALSAAPRSRLALMARPDRRLDRAAGRSAAEERREAPEHVPEVRLALPRRRARGDALRLRPLRPPLPGSGARAHRAARRPGLVRRRGGRAPLGGSARVLRPAPVHGAARGGRAQDGPRRRDGDRPGVDRRARRASSP